MNLLKEMENKNAPLKKLVANVELDKAILSKLASGNFRTLRCVLVRWNMYVVFRRQSRYQDLVCIGSRKAAQ